MQSLGSAKFPIFVALSVYTRAYDRLSTGLSGKLLRVTMPRRFTIIAF